MQGTMPPRIQKNRTIPLLIKEGAMEDIEGSNPENLLCLLGCHAALYQLIVGFTQTFLTTFLKADLFAFLSTFLYTELFTFLDADLFAFF